MFADGPGAVWQAARLHGLGALYRGSLRTSASGIAIGAMTFGIYDAALHLLA